MPYIHRFLAFRKRALYLVALLQKTTCNLRHILWIFATLYYGVVTTSRLLKIIGLFCRISSLLKGSFAKETYNFKESTKRSHPIRAPSTLPLSPLRTPLLHPFSACHELKESRTQGRISRYPQPPYLYVHISRTQCTKWPPCPFAACHELKEASLNIHDLHFCMSTFHELNMQNDLHALLLHVTNSIKISVVMTDIRMRRSDWVRDVFWWLIRVCHELNQNISGHDGCSDETFWLSSWHILMTHQSMSRTQSDYPITIAVMTTYQELDQSSPNVTENWIRLWGG